ncbi:MAG: hypothetical protein P794_06520 [Epsilonproteobacteria bacterium (ex Lamellibrachia satsuma)]|nr:MAG: hypothetical protein P794_06520 [Epsilonproteobacteria bacterium (ex Lamellibrachia satsuma)]
MNLEAKYPKLFEKLEDKEITLRHLLNVDENYEDFDSEEYEFDFEDYNFVIYIAEPVQQALGEAKMNELMVKLQDEDAFVNFVASEEDLYGVKSILSNEEIVSLVLDQVEAIV